MIKLIAMTLIILTISSAGAFASYSFGKYLENNMDDEIDSFDSCIAAGFPVQETAPPRCMDSKGNTFVDFDDVNEGYTNCVNKGGKVSEEQIVCVMAPCNPIVSCTIEGKTYRKN